MLVVLCIIDTWLIIGYIQTLNNPIITVVSDSGEDIFVVNNDEMTKREKYQAYLEQNIENDFESIEGIDSATAEVSYETETDQYSILLRLSASNTITENQIEEYINYLENGYSGSVTLEINDKLIDLE